MPPTEIAGDFSGFGEQISSERVTAPRYTACQYGARSRTLPGPLEPLSQCHGLDAPAADYRLPVRVQLA